MLWKLEWKNPHKKPFGLTLPEWVDEVRRFEAKGWLIDPRIFRRHSPAPPEAHERRERIGKLCLRLCWRERCHRAGRCRTLLPLAIRDFQPEYGVHLHRIAERHYVYYGDLDPEKMAILAERLVRKESGPLTRKRPEEQ
ncbi:hypothetical protein BH10PSE7_BH10PSE7_44380 [soil metagenome]